MNQSASQIYICPMHSSVRQSSAGTCPKCGMALLPEGTKFGLVRHLMQNRAMLIAMVVVMLAIMAAIMMMVHR